MIWKGKELKTIEDLMKLGIDQCNTEEEAQQFMMEYIFDNAHARDNIGYLSGYYNRKDQERIFRWFDVVHPIFGTKQLSTDEMMRIGIEMGKREKNKTEDLNVVEFIKANIRIKQQ